MRLRIDNLVTDDQQRNHRQRGAVVEEQAEVQDRSESGEHGLQCRTVQLVGNGTDAGSPVEQVAGRIATEEGNATIEQAIPYSTLDRNVGSDRKPDSNDPLGEGEERRSENEPDPCHPQLEDQPSIRVGDRAVNNESRGLWGQHSEQGHEYREPENQRRVDQPAAQRVANQLPRPLDPIRERAIEHDQHGPEERIALDVDPDVIGG
jgi:hypothetical protein